MKRYTMNTRKNTINRQDRQKMTFHGSVYLKEICQQCTPAIHTEAVHCQEVLLGSSICVFDHYRLLDPPCGRVAKPLDSTLTPVPPAAEKFDDMCTHVDTIPHEGQREMCTDQDRALHASGCWRAMKTEIHPTSATAALNEPVATGVMENVKTALFVVTSFNSCSKYPPFA